MAIPALSPEQFRVTPVQSWPSLVAQSATCGRSRTSPNGSARARLTYKTWPFFHAPRSGAASATGYRPALPRPHGAIPPPERNQQGLRAGLWRRPAWPRRRHSAVRPDPGNRSIPWLRGVTERSDRGRRRARCACSKSWRKQCALPRGMRQNIALALGFVESRRASAYGRYIRRDVRRLRVGSSNWRPRWADVQATLAHVLVAKSAVPWNRPSGSIGHPRLIDRNVVESVRSGRGHHRPQSLDSVEEPGWRRGFMRAVELALIANRAAPWDEATTGRSDGSIRWSGVGGLGRRIHSSELLGPPAISGICRLSRRRR